MLEKLAMITIMMAREAQKILKKSRMEFRLQLRKLAESETGAMQRRFSAYISLTLNNKLVLIEFCWTFKTV